MHPLAFPVAAADLNGDGKIDVAVTNINPLHNGSCSVSVYLGNGDGSFQAQVTYLTAKHPLGLAIADLNGDGKPDLTFANYYSDNIGVLLGNGNGAFQGQNTFAVGRSLPPSRQPI